jgi:hypothetical protein
MCGLQGTSGRSAVPREPQPGPGIYRSYVHRRVPDRLEEGAGSSGECRRSEMGGSRCTQRSSEAGRTAPADPGVRSDENGLRRSGPQGASLTDRGRFHPAAATAKRWTVSPTSGLAAHMEGTCGRSAPDKDEKDREQNLKVSALIARSAWLPQRAGQFVNYRMTPAALAATLRATDVPQQLVDGARSRRLTCSQNRR